MPIQKSMATHGEKERNELRTLASVCTRVRTLVVSVVIYFFFTQFAFAADTYDDSFPDRLLHEAVVAMRSENGIVKAADPIRRLIHFHRGSFKLSQSLYARIIANLNSPNRQNRAIAALLLSELDPSLDVQNLSLRAEAPNPSVALREANRVKIATALVYDAFLELGASAAESATNATWNSISSTPHKMLTTVLTENNSNQIIAAAAFGRPSSDFVDWSERLRSGDHPFQQELLRQLGPVLASTLDVGRLDAREGTISATQLERVLREYEQTIAFLERFRSPVPEAVALRLLDWLQPARLAQLERLTGSMSRATALLQRIGTATSALLRKRAGKSDAIVQKILEISDAFWSNYLTPGPSGVETKYGILARMAKNSKSARNAVIEKYLTSMQSFDDESLSSALNAALVNPPRDSQTRDILERSLANPHVMEELERAYSQFAEELEIDRIQYGIDPTQIIDSAIPAPVPNLTPMQVPANQNRKPPETPAKWKGLVRLGFVTGSPDRPILESSNEKILVAFYKQHPEFLVLPNAFRAIDEIGQKVFASVVTDLHVIASEKFESEAINLTPSLGAYGEVLRTLVLIPRHSLHQAGEAPHITVLEPNVIEDFVAILAKNTERLSSDLQFELRELRLAIISILGDRVTLKNGLTEELILRVIASADSESLLHFLRNLRPDSFAVERAIALRVYSEILALIESKKPTLAKAMLELYLTQLERLLLSDPEAINTLNQLFRRTEKFYPLDEIAAKAPKLVGEINLRTHDGSDPSIKALISVCSKTRP